MQSLHCNIRNNRQILRENDVDFSDLCLYLCGDDGVVIYGTGKYVRGSIFAPGKPILLQLLTRFDGKLVLVCLACLEFKLLSTSQESHKEGDTFASGGSSLVEVLSVGHRRSVSDFFRK